MFFFFCSILIRYICAFFFVFNFSFVVKIKYQSTGTKKIFNLFYHIEDKRHVGHLQKGFFIQIQIIISISKLYHSNLVLFVLNLHYILTNHPIPFIYIYKKIILLFLLYMNICIKIKEEER